MQTLPRLVIDFKTLCFGFRAKTRSGSVHCSSVAGQSDGRKQERKGQGQGLGQGQEQRQSDCNLFLAMASLINAILLPPLLEHVVGVLLPARVAAIEQLATDARRAAQICNVWNVQQLIISNVNHEQPLNAMFTQEHIF